MTDDPASHAASVSSPVCHISEDCGCARKILPRNSVAGAEAKANREQHQGDPTPRNLTFKVIRHFELP